MALVKQLIRKQQFAMHAEASQFTYYFTGGTSNPVTADLIPCAGPVTFTPKADVIKNETLLAHFGHLDDKPTVATAEMKGKCYINMSGTAGTAPLIGTLLKAAGLKETVVAVTSVTYKPSASLTELGTSFSALLIEDGYGYGISGAQVSDLTFNFEAGKPCLLEWTLVGAYQAVAAKTAATLPASLPTGVVFYNAGTTPIIPSWANPEFRKYQIHIKNTMADQIDANYATNYGYKGAQISFREITGSIDPTFDPSNYDVFAAWLAGTTGAISTGTLSDSTGGAGHRFSITAGRCQYTGSPSVEDRGGFRAHTWPFSVNVAANAADGDDLSISFT